MYSSCRDVVMKCEKQWWKKEGDDVEVSPISDD